MWMFEQMLYACWGSTQRSRLVLLCSEMINVMHFNCQWFYCRLLGLTLYVDYLGLNSFFVCV